MFHFSAPRLFGILAFAAWIADSSAFVGSASLSLGYSRVSALQLRSTSYPAHHNALQLKMSAEPRGKDAERLAAKVRQSEIESRMENGYKSEQAVEAVHTMNRAAMAKLPESKLAELFASVDADASGSISADEMAKAFSNLDRDMSQESVQEVMDHSHILTGFLDSLESDFSIERLEALPSQSSKVDVNTCM